MKNCHADLLAYHDEDVTLPRKERTEMQKRRDTNRQRLKQGLERDNAPKPDAYRSQGSYAMWTMVQQPGKDYDVDDGTYFDIEKLRGPQGGDMSGAAVREMVRKALHNDRFKRPPEKLKHCVRVYYDEGYHVDVPAYRRIVEKDAWGNESTRVELASTEWKPSNPLAVTDWFLNANKQKSPDTDNGGQLRRTVRLLKAYARSRPSWRNRIATGFMITKLVVERYWANASREDEALYYTMVGIRDRLNWDLEIKHPTVPGEILTKGPQDSEAKFLRDKLNWAIDELSVLFQGNCSDEQAVKAWDKVFNTTFFADRLEDTKTYGRKREVVEAGALGTGMASAILIKGAEKAAAERPVDKHGGGRYA